MPAPSTAHQIVVRTDNSGDGIYTLHADSVSGAGTTVAGLAGAVSVTLAMGTSNAFVGNPPAIPGGPPGPPPTLVLTGAGDLLIQADATIDNVATATPAIDASIAVGVGASVELNSGNFATVAELMDANISGA